MSYEDFDQNEKESPVNMEALLQTRDAIREHVDAAFPKSGITVELVEDDGKTKLNISGTDMNGDRSDNNFPLTGDVESDVTVIKTSFDKYAPRTFSKTGEIGEDPKEGLREMI